MIICDFFNVNGGDIMTHITRYFLPFLKFINMNQYNAIRQSLIMQRQTPE